MGKIIYIRHGQASLFSENYDQLSSIGLKQSQLLGKHLSDSGIEVHKVYCGPLNRHRQTMEGVLVNLHKSPAAIEIDEGLKEHEGFHVLKSILPQLIEHDEEIRMLVNIPYSGKKDQILHHLKVYENFSLRWSKGEFDEWLVNNHSQTWKEFINVAKESFSRIALETADDQNVLVFTSGGPKAVACGTINHLSHSSIMELSWEIYNGALSDIVKKDNQLSLSIFNNTSYYTDQMLKTLV
ncbi:MAG TPA: phosphoglycerate mutase family protein [Saprospiraceae bacterium]|nr:phosphoglycerate mutase family protein [Saprospiraceae bacterium]